MPAGEQQRLAQVPPTDEGLPGVPHGQVRLGAKGAVPAPHALEARGLHRVAHLKPPPPSPPNLSRELMARDEWKNLGFAEDDKDKAKSA